MVSFEYVRVLSVTTPSLLVVSRVLLSLEVGAGVEPEVEDQVDVVLEDEPCATATPDIVARTAAAASHVLIMSFAFWELSASGNRSLPPLVIWGA